MRSELPQQFTIYPAKITKKDSKSKTDEDFLREAELRGMGEPNRNEERPVPINELGSDLLPHDVAEEWGINKDEDRDGVVIKDFDYGNQRIVMPNHYNDIGEELFEDEEELEEEQVSQEQKEAEEVILKRVTIDQNKETKKEPTNKTNGAYKGMNYTRQNSRPVWPR